MDNKTSSARHQANCPMPLAGTEEMLDALQRESFNYFIHNTSPIKGLVLDKSRDGWPASIAAIGLALGGYDYIARGVPFGPDDGTLAPWAVVASLPFAPEIVLPTIRNFEHMRLKETQGCGYKATFNPTFPVQPRHEYGWISPYHFGINQGPIVIMIENHRSGFLWALMRQCPYLVTGLRRAGFSGGWLE